MERNTIFWIGILATIFLLCCGCTGREQTSSPGQDQQAMGNPAAIYCNSLGYKSEIRTDQNGSQYGVCCMPNGTEIDE
jgi:hypothetical protein